MLINRSKAWLERASKVIPSATQTYSKGPGQWVQGVTPAYLERGEGAFVWDVDGNRFLDYSMALGTVSLGYGHPEVLSATTTQLVHGASFSMMHPLEVVVAEQVCEMVPCAEMVRFGKNGSDVTTAMVRVARAYTQRARVAVCGYQGWHDWNIGATSRHRGVPREVRGLTHAFEYNDLESLAYRLEAHPGEFALILLEPMGFTFPAPGFLSGVKELARKHGALLGFDEVVTGFRLHPGGAQGLFGVVPDLAAFGKGMANGLPLSCLAGRREVMALFDEVFFSLTFGGEAVSLAAAHAVLRILADGKALSAIADHGNRFHAATQTLISRHGLEREMRALGHGSHWGILLRAADAATGRLWRTFLIQECVKRGYLFFGVHNPTPAHNDETMNLALAIYDEVFALFAQHLRGGTVADALEGPVIEEIFRSAS